MMAAAGEATTTDKIRLANTTRVTTAKRLLLIATHLSTQAKLQKTAQAPGQKELPFFGTKIKLVYGLPKDGQGLIKWHTSKVPLTLCSDCFVQHLTIWLQHSFK